MRVLSVASEVYPLVKTGGLADVAGALPPALARRGIAVRTLVPGYPAVMGRIGEGRVLHAWSGLLGAEARLLAAEAEGLELMVLDAPVLFDRPGGPYALPGGGDHPDNWRRFAALSRAGAEIAGGVVPEFQPDLVHAHDWQAAMTPAYMRYAGRGAAVGGDGAQPRLPGAVSRRHLRRARAAAAGLRARRGRVLRHGRVPEGRARERDRASPPSARPTPRRSRPPPSAWGSTG